MPLTAVRHDMMKKILSATQVIKQKPAAFFNAAGGLLAGNN